MIIDKLSNSGLYKFCNEGIISALEYLRNTDFNKLTDGKYEIDGDNIYAIVSIYTPKKENESYLESHKKYIDVQCVLEGAERVGYLHYTGQDLYKEYDEENDYTLFNENCSYLAFGAGMFTVFFPDDLHKPGIEDGSDQKVRKVVIKVRI